MLARYVSIFALAFVSQLAGNASAQHIVPSALLTIDQNRSTVVERIVSQWGDPLARSNVGISSAQLREILNGLRADHLLAASLAGSVEGLRDVVSGALVHTGAAVSQGLMHTKSLGDIGDDLAYTPVVPCRLADTRVAGGAIAANTTRDFKVWVSSGGFTGQGGDSGNCNVPANPPAVVLNFAVVNPGGSAI